MWFLSLIHLRLCGLFYERLVVEGRNSDELSSLYVIDNKHHNKQKKMTNMTLATEEVENESVWLEDFTFNGQKNPYPTILLVGKRHSGKSWTSVCIASQYPHVPRWCAWCGTKETEYYWADRFGSHATVKGPDDTGKAYLIRVIKYQQRKVCLYKKVLKEPFPPKYGIGLIFDDVTSNRKFRKGEILEDLFSNGRHYKAVIIISCQYLKQLPPAVRLNTDYLFMMHNSKQVIKILYEEYIEEPEQFHMFHTLLKGVTSQKDSAGKDLFNALVFDNAKKASSLEEMFKVHRTPDNFDPKSIMLGHPAWRAYNQQHYRDKEEERQKREYRKQCQRARMAAYQRKQMEARQRYGDQYANYIMQDPVDIDTFSDSEPEEEEYHTVTVREKKRGGGAGHTINFRMATGKARASPAYPPAHVSRPTPPVAPRGFVETPGLSAIQAYDSGPTPDAYYTPSPPPLPPTAFTQSYNATPYATTARYNAHNHIAPIPVY